MNKIFISYRREDSAAYVGRLFEDLRRKFGRSTVFMDIDTIEPGQPFAERISSSVQSATVVLVAIGRRWLDVTDSNGRRRIDNQDDFVRLEIETALTSHLRVIPVLFGGAAPLQTDSLPESLRPLATFQAIEISDARFPYDVNRLSKSIYRGLSKQDRLRIFVMRHPVFLCTVFVACLIVGGVTFNSGEWIHRAANLTSYRQSVELSERTEAVLPRPDIPESRPSSSSTQNQPGLSTIIDVETMKLKREIDKLGQITDLIKNGQVFGTIGIHLAQGSSYGRPYIESVDPKGAGVRAGLIAGDILTALDGTLVEHGSDATFAILKWPVGTTHMVAVTRGTRELAYPVVAEVMGDSDIKELKAIIEDRARIMNRKLSNSTK